MNSRANLVLQNLLILYNVHSSKSSRVEQCTYCPNTKTICSSSKSIP